MNCINRFDGQYAFLSNFYPTTVVFNGTAYPSAEAAYQAAKCLDPEEARYFIHCYSAAMAKKRGKTVKIRPDWNDVKIDTMQSIVLAKFMQNKELRALLLDTGDAELIEGNYWNDTFWGICRGRGANHLGKILMAIRDELK